MEDSQRIPAYTVTQALTAAKCGLETICLTVIGEVSQFRGPSKNGHAFFEIHDEDSAMSCVLWRDRYNSCGVELQAGMLVELKGRFSCHVAKGRMQFVVDAIDLAGEGRLRMQVAQLARKLEAEGLMDASRKRLAPALPQRIAVVTSGQGKAVHDVVRTLLNRYPMGHVYVSAVTVEGPNAPAEIIKGLEAAWNAPVPPDVILLVRGGGSYEDLMPFNDESLARAVASSPIPIVTGIGHEPDNSICDMVADRRCSTPTAAAEAVTPTVSILKNKLRNAQSALQRSLDSYMHAQQLRFENLQDRPLWRDPYFFTGQLLQTLDGLEERLSRAIPEALSKDAHSLAILRTRLVNLGSQLLAEPRRELALAAAKIDALSPLKTLSRGYSIAYAQDGRSVIDSIAGIDVGQIVQVQVQDGKLVCTVDQVKGDDHV